MAITLTKDNFSEEVLEYKGLVLVDFWASWCGPCKMIAPIIDEIAEEYAGKLKVGKVNVDNELWLAQKHQVVSIPTLILFQDGEIIMRHVGYASKDELVKKIGDRSKL